MLKEPSPANGVQKFNVVLVAEQFLNSWALITPHAQSFQRPWNTAPNFLPSLSWYFCLTLSFISIQPHVEVQSER